LPKRKNQTPILPHKQLWGSHEQESFSIYRFKLIQLTIELKVHIHKNWQRKYQVIVLSSYDHSNDMVGYLVPKGGTTKVMMLIPSHCKIGDYGFGEVDASLSKYQEYQNINNSL